MVRLMSLPNVPPNRAPVWDVIEAMEQKAAQRREVDEIEGVLAPFHTKS